MSLCHRLKQGIALLCLAFLAACSSNSNSHSFRIGVDKSFFPIDSMGQEKNMFGFTQDVLAEVAAKHDLNIVYVPINWDNVISSIKDKKTDAVVSTLRPYVFYKKDFDFSSLFLPTGPVLITTEKASYKKIEDFSGKILGIITGSGDELLIETHSGVIIHTFDTINNLLNALIKGDVDGILLDTLLANAYCRDLYQGKIKVVSSPLTDEGLRLMSMKDEHKTFIEEFNNTLEELEHSKNYQGLLAKWQLNMPCN